jgi:hypothetical protein
MFGCISQRKPETQLTKKIKEMAGKIFDISLTVYHTGGLRCVYTIGNDNDIFSQKDVLVDAISKLYSERNIDTSIRYDILDTSSSIITIRYL